jgi:hypothetical protein
MTEIPADEVVLPKPYRTDIPWYTGRTDDLLADPQAGQVLTFETRDGVRASDISRSVRLDEAPFPRLAYHADVDWSIFRRYEWLKFWFAFGTEVFDHAPWPVFSPRPEPDWREYPERYKNGRPATPVAIVWRIEDNPHQLSTAEYFRGTPGQDPGQFKAQVLAELPEPHSREERFAMCEGPITVVVAAAPHQDVEDGIAQLHDPGGRISVLRAETVDQLMTLIGIADVVIIDNVLPSTKEGVLVHTCGSFDLIRVCKRHKKFGLIGAPMTLRRQWLAGEELAVLNYDYVCMHMTAVCGERMIYDRRCEHRHIMDLVLDALGLPVTKPAEPIPASI